MLFVKVENDGFELGAQRRPIQKNDLPEALEILNSHKKAQKSQEGKIALAVSRKRILESPDVNLSGDRYRVAAAVQSKWPMVKLGEVADINQQSCDPEKLYGQSTFVYLDISSVENGSGLISFENRVKGVDAPSRAKRVVRQGDILLSTVRPNLQAFAYIESVPRDAVASTGFAVITPQIEKVNGHFLYNLLFAAPVMEQMLMRMGKGAYPSITQSDVEEIEIPLPALEIQRQIVVELDGNRKVIEGARQVIANYRPHIPIHPDWPELELGEACQFIDYRGKTPKKTANGVPLITAKNVRDGHINPEPREFIAEGDYDSWMTRGIPAVGDVLFTTEAPLGNAAEVTSKERFALAQRLIALSPNRELLMGAFLKDVLLSKQMQERIFAFQTGSTVYGIKASVLKEIKIPVPPLETQQRIVAEIESERAMVEANRKLVEIFEKKIQSKLVEILGSGDDSRKEAQE